MNKIIASTAIVFAAALSGAAFAADNDTNTINAQGNAANFANLGNKVGGGNFGALLNPNTGFVKVGQKIITYPNALINYNGFVNIKSTSGAMIPPAPLPIIAGFEDKVNYIATATFDTASLTYTTTGSVVPTLGTNRDEDPVGPATGLLTLTLDIPVGGPSTINPLPLQASGYSDTVTVGLGASL